MPSRNKLAMVLACLFLVACSPSLYRQGLIQADRGQYDEAVASFYADIQADPQSHRSWREMGVVHYRAGNLDRALEALLRAQELQVDARAKVFEGLVYEKKGDLDAAYRAFLAARMLDPDGDTGRILTLHLDDLFERKIRGEIEAAKANEANLDPQDIPANSICILEFDEIEVEPGLESLGVGLLEFTLADLGEISDLTVVERMKLDILRQEIEFSRSSLADPASRLRMGLLTGSRHLVTGTMSIADGNIQIQSAIGDVGDEPPRFLNVIDGAVEKDFFAVQDSLVFQIVGALGIYLSPEERAAIQIVPTRSLAAMLAYCEGLELRDRGDFRAAEDKFRSAQNLDQSFHQAGQAHTDTKAMSAAQASGEGGSGIESVERSSLAAGPPPADPQQVYLETMIDASGFVPGTEGDDTLLSQSAALPNTGAVNTVSTTIWGRIND